MPGQLLRTLMLTVLFAVQAHGADARSIPARWGAQLTPIESASNTLNASKLTDSLLRLKPSVRQPLVYNIQRPVVRRNQTLDFYLLCGLCLMLGAIRYFDPRYFSLLFGAFRDAGSGRQWKEMLKATALPNLAMNVFFALVAGTYIFYLAKPHSSSGFSGQRPLLLLLLVGGMLATYAIKYIVIKFSGWVFKAEGIADQYLFNVLLINKITSVVLLPFVIILAFAGEEWLKPIGFLSAVIVCGLLAVRYLRSWSQLLGVFRGSRFHFFTYLCASEILPMAVLVKWMLHLIS